MSSIVIGHTHINATSDAQTDAGPSRDNSSPHPTRHALHLVIANNTKAPASTNTPITSDHGHNARFVFPAAEERLASIESGSWTPGHGHGGFVVFPSPRDSTTPTALRPSARASRRSSLFTTVDEAHNGSWDEGEDAENEHPLSNVARSMTLPPTMETEEPPSAELDGHFEQPANDHGVQTHAEEGSSEAVGHA
ncbi:hypothetical protein C8Q77DRAFT_1065750 [Trametes polyzona]|nr:hypothetical protein C8Q77DRAFT_1065750 [Trametes polyzona]